MIDRVVRRPSSRLIASAGLVLGGIFVAACYRRAAPEASPPPMIPAQELSAPVGAQPAVPPANPLIMTADTANEVHVDIDTHGNAVDVRTLLDFIASKGRFTLVYSPDISTRIRLQMIDVPVSVALQTVLTVAGLTVESATPEAKTPESRSVVFYQLPVNIDSLSVDAIMQRFGVGRAIAELIVQARTNRP
jgi:hypothetical protein